MQAKASLLQLMNSSTIRLSKSDKKLAAIIQADPAVVIHQSIAVLATAADVSEPTVNRFCHKLGCDGYPDFKLRLAQEISSNGQLFVDNLSRDDDSSMVIKKIMSSIQGSIQSLANTIDPTVLDASAEAIAQCKSVHFFGMGASSSVALDAQHKFFRFGMPVIAHTDYINQRMACSMMDSNDVAVFISYTGRTDAMIINAELAKQCGAVVIGITAQTSVLAAQCQYVLNAVTAEDTDLFTPMTSRIIHLAVIDMLATSVALKLGDRVERNIKAIKKNLAATRTDR
ncbi:transcriptional regulator HexR [Arenicella xantha]|uniref:RpiR family transcriptional regulator n=1 Tax=Arenicella xantha TaxID=644221 RepID=A0A395JIZ1_9GAMM|nr:transcriptional regulator HexR [Arenicella xantha]RBP49739.1 RpiR family transcriptional regulator [Arenicella xantha]